jgi:cobalamin biosynthesis protein CobD/CbiB
MKRILNFILKIFNANDSTANSKIIGVCVGLMLLIMTTIFVLLGIPPVTASYVSDLIWGLVALISTLSGAEVVNTIFKRNGGEEF